MAAGTIAPVDHDHVDVGLVDQRVGERERGSTGTDHEVVGLERGHEAGPVVSMEGGVRSVCRTTQYRSVVARSAARSASDASDSRSKESRMLRNPTGVSR